MRKKKFRVKAKTFTVTDLFQLLPQQRKNYYVYVLRRKDKRNPFNEKEYYPFYVGKGCGRRIWDHRRNARMYLKTKNKKYITNPRQTRIILSLWKKGMDFIEEFLIDKLAEKEAYKKEKEYIKLWGRELEGGLLCNIDAGGDNGRGEWTEEQKLKAVIRQKIFTKIKYCEWCGKIYGKKSQTYGNHDWERRKYCGIECQHTAIKMMNYFDEIKWCESCEKVYKKPEKATKKDWERRTLCKNCILKIKLSKTRKPLSEEHKEKVSNAKLGKKHKNPKKTIDENHKKNIGETQKRNHQLKSEGKFVFEYRDKEGYCEIKYCQRCGKVFGRYKNSGKRDWEKKIYCCPDCRFNRKPI